MTPHAHPEYVDGCYTCDRERVEELTDIFPDYTPEERAAVALFLEVMSLGDRIDTIEGGTE